MGSAATIYAEQIIFDQEIDDMVRSIANPIVKVAGFQPDQIKFYIILNDEVNAFVYGGKNIFIYTGLITLFNDPDVLKGVIAHELGHITGGHLARRQENIDALLPQHLVTNLIGAAAAIGGAGDVGMAIISGSGHSLERSVLRNSRENESAADQAAFSYLYKSGNSSAGLLKLLNYLQQSKRMGDSVNPYSVSHPVDSQRISALNLDQKVRNGHFFAQESEKERYGLAVAKLRAFTTPLNKIAAVQASDLSPLAKSYWQAIVSYRKSHIALALQAVDALLTQRTDNPYFYELKGQLLFELGNIQAALAAYKKAITLLPQADFIKLEYVSVLVNYNGKVSKEELQNAVDLLQRASIKQRNNPWIYRNLGIAYGKLGDLAQSNLLLAQAAILQNNYSEAKKFIYNAKKHVKNNPKILLHIEDLERQIE